MREIVLSGGEPALRVYDTSGPLGADVRLGLPSVRGEWIRARGDVVETERTYRPLPGTQPVEMPESLHRKARAGFV